MKLKLDWAALMRQLWDAVKPVLLGAIGSQNEAVGSQNEAVDPRNEAVNPQNEAVNLAGRTVRPAGETGKGKETK